MNIQAPLMSTWHFNIKPFLMLQTSYSFRAFSTWSFEPKWEQQGYLSLIAFVTASRILMQLVIKQAPQCWRKDLRGFTGRCRMKGGREKVHSGWHPDEEEQLYSNTLYACFFKGNKENKSAVLTRRRQPEDNNHKEICSYFLVKELFQMFHSCRAHAQLNEDRDQWWRDSMCTNLSKGKTYFL